jgi:hypothetical protein
LRSGNRSAPTRTSARTPASFRGSIVHGALRAISDARAASDVTNKSRKAAAMRMPLHP